MAGRGSRVTFYPYLVVFNLCWKDGIVEYNETSEPNITVQIDLSKRGIHFPNAESYIIRKDMAEKLSSDTKSIVRLVLDDSEETACLKKKNSPNKISKEKIYKYLRNKGWKRARINKAFSELKDFVSCFD